MGAAKEYGITPGPWSFAYVGAYGYIARGAQGVQIANVLPKQDFVTSEQAKANARAIAEVPNMIHELQVDVDSLEASAKLRELNRFEQVELERKRAILARIKSA